MTDTTAELESKWQPILMFYGCAFFLIIMCAQLSPTSLAGPGLDMIFILLAMVGNINLLFRSVFKLKKRGKGYRLAVIIHGSIFMLWFGFIMIAIIYATIISR